MFISSCHLLLINKYYSPQYSVTDAECRKYVFHICQLIAQHSDAGRQALIDAKILPELSCLASSRIVTEVISACKVLKALAHTGTFGQDIISAGLQTSMEHITRYDSFDNFWIFCNFLTSRQSIPKIDSPDQGR